MSLKIEHAIFDNLNKLNESTQLNEARNPNISNSSEFSI
jgi:hypothetical protein